MYVPTVPRADSLIFAASKAVKSRWVVPRLTCSYSHRNQIRTKRGCAAVSSFLDPYVLLEETEAIRCGAELKRRPPSAGVIKS